MSNNAVLYLYSTTLSHHHEKSKHPTTFAMDTLPETNYCLSIVSKAGHLGIVPSVAKKLGLQKIRQTSRAFPAGNAVYLSRVMAVGEWETVRFVRLRTAADVEAAELITNMMYALNMSENVPDSATFWTETRETTPSPLIHRLKHCMQCSLRIHELARKIAEKLKLQKIRALFDLVSV